ncbi:MAG: NusA-like transcription termination signal-binding factor [Candidatus Micrarchaeota archaeon]|nr:NusA-like transcription termination signal-binding factor [Candidatus Micrarchaeota archaeon]
MVELTNDDLNMFSVFENITRVMPSDYEPSATLLIFLVPVAELGKAIGKNGSNMQKLRDAFKRKVIIIGDMSDPELFVRGMFNNISILSVEVQNIMGDLAIVLTIDEKDRGIAIGKEGERIKAAKEILRKKFKATIHLKTRRSVI